MLRASAPTHPVFPRGCSGASAESESVAVAVYVPGSVNSMPSVAVGRAPLLHEAASFRLADAPLRTVQR